MLKRSKITACLLLTILLLCSCVFAQAADAESSLANLRVRFRVSVPALDDASYTVWASGVSFAVGDPGAQAAYYVTDAALLDYEYVLQSAAPAILAELEKGGITGVTADTLSRELDVESVETVLFTQDAERPVTLVTAENGWALLGIIEAANYVEAPVLPITTTIPTGDVTYWSAGDAAFGITRGTQPAAGFLRLSGTVAAIEGDNVTLNADYSPLSLGSPLVDTAGQVFGLIVSDPDSGAIRAVGTQTLRDALQTVGVLTKVNETITEKTEAIAGTDSFRQLIMAATAAAGVLLIIIIILLILRSRRPARRAADPVRKVDTERQYSAPRAAAASVTPVRAEPASRPRVSTAPSGSTTKIPAPTAPVTTAPPPPTVLLTILDGRLQGQTRHVSGTAMIGRDPKVCSLVFGATQTDISRRHCQITYNPATGDIVLEDLNSANGTYTPDGRRFAAGRKYLLRSGDRFYLGLKENMIEVRK